MTTTQLSQASMLDILFENRNKDYGAYALRHEYEGRLWKALLIALLLSLGLLAVKPRHQQGMTNAVIKDSVRITPYTAMKDPQLPPPVRSRAASATAASTDRTNMTVVVAPDDQIDPKNRPTDADAPATANTGNANGNIDGDQPTGTGISANPPVVVAPPAAVDDKALETSPPEFPGGIDALMRFLRRNLQTPGDLEAGEKKVVRVRFNVDTNGSISTATVETSGGDEFDREVIRVCKKMPTWKPAKQNGKLVNISYVLPVIFVGEEQ